MFVLYSSSCSSNISSVSCLSCWALLYFQELFSVEFQSPFVSSLSLIFGFLVLLSFFTTFSAGCNLCLVKIGDPKYWANQRHLLVYFLTSMVCWHAQAVADFFCEGREDAVYSEPADVKNCQFQTGQMSQCCVCIYKVWCLKLANESECTVKKLF